MAATLNEEAPHGPMLSLTEAAAYLRCHHNTVRAWVRQGKLEAVPMGPEKVAMYRKSDVERLKLPLEKAGVIIKDDRHAFPVVGIGASAGGLDAISRTLAHLPTDLGLAYVVVQHLETERETVLADLLRKKTTMPVFVIENGMRVDPDRVYVATATAHVAITNGTFTLRAPQERTRPIDAFFTALASEYQNNAIGIVLSGTGTDGTNGLRAIRAEDGLTMAQDVSALEQAMPRHAEESEVVDMVVKPEDIGKELAHLVDQFYPGGQAWIPSKHENELRRILHYLHAQRGIDFTQYKEATIHRRIIRRMVLSKCLKLSDYSALLHGTPSEVDTLCNDMLINVTSFFRDPLFFKALDQLVFPALLKDRALNDPLRIWVAACAGGEEVVSVAITLLEHIGDRALTVPVQIFATDLNERTVEKARLGIYKKNALQQLPPEQVQKYFQHVDGHYQVIKTIRDMCVFAKHDLLKDPPFSRVDLISCQNMLIYVDNPAQERVVKSFHYALKPSGFLALGKSESASVAGAIFDQPDSTFKVYTKKYSADERLNMDMRYTPTPLRSVPEGRGPILIPRWNVPADLDRDTERVLLTRYVPASVLINQRMEIIRFRGAVAPYLAPTTGKASLHLLKMVRDDLTFELRGLLQRVKKEKDTVRKGGIPLRVDDVVKHIALEVVPMGDQREPHYLVLFTDELREVIVARPVGRKGKNVRDERERRIIQLEQELAEAREQMRIAAEEAEAGQQDLQAANEEVVSSNEELQSINEELETSKEELQSINEEFATINEELQVRNDALLESEERYRQLIHLMPVAVFTCESDGRIGIYNERALELWGRVPERREGEWHGAYKLYSADGKPLANQDAPMGRAVREGIAISNEELIIERPDGKRRSVLVSPTPLHDGKGRSLGAISVLVDITERKQAEEERQQLTGMLERSLNEIYIFDVDSLKFDYVNHGALSNLGYTLEQMRHMTPVDIKPEIDARQFDTLVEPLRSREKEKLQFYTIHRRANGSDYPVEVHLQIMDKGPRRVFMAMILDISERKLDEERLSVITRTGKLGIWDWDILADTIVWTDPVYAIHGVHKGSFEPSMEGYHQLIHPEDREQVAAAIKATLEKDAPYEIEFRTLNAEGTVNWVYTNAVLIREHGKPVRMMGGTMNITARREAEDALRMSEQRYHVLADNLPQMIYIGDLTGKTIWVNDRWVEFTGLSSEDVIAGKWADAVHPDDAGPMMESYLACFAKEQDWEFTFRIKNKEGRYRWFLSRCVPLRGAQGEVLRWFGTNTDVTAQQEAQSLTRAMAERKDFVLRLNDALRPLLDPVEVQAEASRILAEHLGVERAGYFEVRGDDFVLEVEHTHGVPSVAGRYPITSFGAKVLSTYRSGRTAISVDVHSDPELSPEEIAAYDAITTGAFIGVPLVKEGEFVAGLAVAGTTARAWTPEEITLVEEAAERLWTAVARTRTAAELQQSEARFRHTADNAPVLIWISGLDKLCYWFNKPWLEFTGRTMEQESGNGWAEGVHPDDMDRCLEIYTTNFDAHQPFSMDYRLRRHDGEYRWLMDNGSPTFDAQGVFTGFIGSCFDITERRDAEISARESEERFRLLSDNIGQLAWIAEPDGAIYWYNKRWFEFTGTTLEEMQGWGWKKIHHPEYVDHTTAKFKYHIEQGIDWQDTFPILGADGKYRWFLSKARPVRDANGTILRWFGTNTDITELRETEDRLRESEANFRLLADNMDQLAMIQDMEGTPIWFNRRWEPTLGVDFANLSREERMDWMHPDDVEHMMQAFISGLSSQKPWDATFRMRVKNGEYRWFLTRSVPVMGSDGQLVSWFTTNTDITETKKAQEVVQEREARLMIATSAAELGIFERRFENDQAVWENDRMFAIFGRTREEGVVPPEEFYRDVLHPEDREMAMRGLEQAIADIGNYNVTMRIKRKNDGLWRKVEVASRVEADTHGKPWRLVGVMGDVTERETDAEAARRLAAIVESSQDAMVSKDLSGIITSWNQAAEQLYGYAADEAVGKSVLMLMPQDRHDEEIMIQERLRQGQRIDHYETVRKKKDGTFFEVSLSVSPIFNADGVAIGAAKVARDISDRKRLEQDISTANAQLRMVTDHMPVAVARVGRDQRFLWASQGYLDWIGLREEQVEGKHLRDVIGDSAYAVLLPYMQQVLKGEPVECLVLVDLPSRGSRWLDVKYAPLYKGGNTPASWIEVITDITQQKLAEEALEESAKHKDHFLATLAHELRNPLAPLKNGLQLMELAPDDPQLLETTRAMMVRQLDHMVRLVDDLMDLSRISRGRIDLVKEDVLLSEVIGTAMEATKPFIERSEHHLRVDISTEELVVHGDAARLIQVVSNLLSNAAKYTPRGGRIDLRVGREQENAVISVKDNGIGIDPAAIDRVFDMFAQVDPVQKGQNSGGLGIGLNVVQRLVQMHKGEVQGRSEGLGKGSEFIVRLPLIAAPEKQMYVALKPETPTTNRRVLVVDDNEDIALSMSLLLKKYGHVVHVAHDGEHAVTLAASFLPDVILMDIGMPKMNGYEACAAIRATEHGKRVHIIAVSGWGQDEDRKKSQDAGFDGHVVKPIERTTLERVIAEAKSVGD